MLSVSSRTIKWIIIIAVVALIFVSVIYTLNAAPSPFSAARAITGMVPLAKIHSTAKIIDQSLGSVVNVCLSSYSSNAFSLCSHDVPNNCELKTSSKLSILKIYLC